MTDDYTLTILPLACLLAENQGIGKYYAKVDKEQTSCYEVLRAGVLGYQLYAYHDWVRNRYGGLVEQRVRDRHIDMLSHRGEFRSILAMIDGAVGIGTVMTSTSQGEIVTPVEMNVALALLLGLPESPCYVSNPAQRSGQIEQMAPEIDWYFADLLALGRNEILRACESLWCDGELPVSRHTIAEPAAVLTH